MKMFYSKIGERIGELRKGRGLTQSVLAKRLGVTTSAVSAYENATAYPSYDILLGLADLFHVTTDYLLGREKSRSVDTKGLTESQAEFVSALVSEFLKNNPPSTER
jgi:transcriptional regulator with XRE-family HTH domain